MSALGVFAGVGGVGLVGQRSAVDLSSAVLAVGLAPLAGAAGLRAVLDSGRVLLVVGAWWLGLGLWWAAVALACATAVGALGLSPIGVDLLARAPAAVAAAATVVATCAIWTVISAVLVLQRPRERK